MIFQSIQTRYLGPTNHRGARIVATTPGGHRLTRPWDYALSGENNDRLAAEALAAKLGWPTIKAGGSTKDGYVWVTSTFEGE